MRHVLSVVALIGLVAGVQVGGLSLVIAVAAAAALLFAFFFEGSFQLWSHAAQDLERHKRAIAQLESDRPALTELLQNELHRAQQLRIRPRISDDGACAPLEVWEKDVVLLLTAEGRQDLAIRFEEVLLWDRMRAAVSGPWATRARIDRKRQLLSAFIRELEQQRPRIT